MSERDVTAMYGGTAGSVWRAPMLSWQRGSSRARAASAKSRSCRSTSLASAHHTRARRTLLSKLVVSEVVRAGPECELAELEVVAAHTEKGWAWDGRCTNTPLG